MTSKSDKEDINYNTPESWMVARKYASLFGDVPSSFSSTIRTLLIDQVKHEKKLTPASRFQVVRLLSGPSAKAMFYYACKTFKEDLIPDADYLTVKDLVTLFEPEDLAAIVAMIFLYRRCRKLCAQDNWQSHADALRLESEVGGHLGLKIPSIGFGTGLLIGALPHLALSAFRHHDSKNFVHYAKYLQEKNLVFDITYEVPRWQASCLQVASAMLQSLGFGLESTESFVKGLDSRFGIDDIKEDSYYRMRIARIWIHSLIDTGDQPDIPMRGAFYPLKEELADLQERIAPVKSSGPVYDWLNRTKEDISEEKTPELFRKKKKAKPENTEDSTSEAPQFPPELLEAFSEEELSKMSPEAIEALLKQMKEKSEED